MRSTRNRDALRQLQDSVLVLPEVDEETGDRVHGSSTDGSDNVTRFPA